MSKKVSKTVANDFLQEMEIIKDINANIRVYRNDHLKMYKK